MLLGGWALATVVATTIGLVALSRVTDQVAPSQALPLPAGGVAAAEAPVATEQPTERQPRPTEPAQTQKPRGRNPSDDPPRQPDAEEPAPEPANPPAAEPAPADPPPAEPEQPAEPEERTEGYELVGGVVTVRYSGESTRLVQAAPKSGFVMEVKDRGPGKVDVRFRSDDHESRLVAQLRDGAPSAERDERER